MSPDIRVLAFAYKDAHKIDLGTDFKILEVFPPQLGGYLRTSTNAFRSTKVRETGGGKTNFTLYDRDLEPITAGFVAFTDIDGKKSTPSESIIRRK
jgi:hypothetical protein